MIGLWVRFGNLRAGEPGRPVAQLPCSSTQSLPIGCGDPARQIVLVLSNLALDQPQAATCHQIAMRADRTIRQSYHATIAIILFDEGTTHRNGRSGSMEGIDCSWLCRKASSIDGAQDSKIQPPRRLIGPGSEGGG